MGTLRWMLACLGTLSITAFAPADSRRQQDLEVLRGAMLLAGPAASGLPLVLTGERHPAASPGAEAWILDGGSRGQRIAIYTGSETFRRAAASGDFQCRLKLASIIVHEAWHLSHGADEAPAYDEQIVFLRSHGASPEMITGVLQARRRIADIDRRARAAHRNDARP